MWGRRWQIKSLLVFMVCLLLPLTVSGYAVRGKKGPASRDLGMVIPFCGQGANAATRYIGPSTGIGVDVTPGNATCDGYDENAAATADEIPFGISIGYTVKGMVCQLNSGTDDTVDMTLYDDTVAVTAITCVITAAGGIETCRVKNTAVIAAGSALAIEADPDNDDLSAQDFYCLLFVSF